MVHTKTGVLVVGAGPVGMTVAIALRQLGIDVIVVEKRSARDTRTSRALMVHARTLEALEGLQVSDVLVADGHRASSFVFRDERKTLLRLPFEDLPTMYPFMLILPQWRTEQVLEERMQALGMHVRYGWTFRGLRQSADHVETECEGPDGESHRLRATFVVGADGGKSAVREAVGIDIDGGDYAGDYLLADVVMQSDLGGDDIHNFLSPKGMMVIETLPDGNQRIVTTDSPSATLPTREELEDLVRVRTGTPAHIESIAWMSRYRVGHGLADAYRRGRVLLAGDAAHQHSPAGGQGMNTGIQDAVTLAGLLERALRDDLAVLDEYERRRRPIAASVIRFSDLFTRAVTVRNGALRRLRNLGLVTVGRVPRLRRAIAVRMAELDV